MSNFCGNCFEETLNDRGICNVCGFDNNINLEKSPHALPPGSILNGRYIIGRVLGQGGFGITYTARDYKTGQLMAVKEFFPDSMATRSGKTSVIPFSGERGENFPYGRDSFLREAQTMAEFIGNSNIVRVYSYFEENGTAYFVMEYVDGMSFQKYLQSKGGRITFEEAMEIILPVMDALSVVHKKGIIHRDVTPDNIYITKDGIVKLLDFGAARYSLGNVSRSLDVILKHGFAPKEQYRRRGHQGPYTDVYSLAATVYFAITGARPDDAIERSDEDDMPYPSSLGAVITRQQEDVLLKAMAVDAADRYQTMDEFRADVNDALKKQKPVSTPPKSPKPPKPSKPDNGPSPTFFERYRIPILAAGAILLAAVILVVCYFNCTFGHAWTEATCTQPMTCQRCGATDGNTPSHDFAAATCTTPQICTVCGQTKGTAWGHSYSSASCTKPKTCSRCGHTDGTTLAHDYKKATCTEPDTCKLCGVQSGMANGHDYAKATCIAPQTCNVCKATTGIALGHDWKLVSGTTTEECTRCSTTRKSQEGLVETMSGDWSSTRVDVGGNRTYAWIFDKKVTDCKQFTMHFQITSYSGNPFGSWKLYAKISGKWEVIGKFSVNDKSEVTKTFTFDNPKTFSQLAVVSTAAGSFSYSSYLWFEDFYLE